MFTDILGYYINRVQCIIMELLELMVPLGPIAQLKNTSTQMEPQSLIIPQNPNYEIMSAMEP